MNFDDIFGLVVSLIFGFIIIVRGIFGMISKQPILEPNEEADDLKRLVPVKEKKAKKHTEKNKNRGQSKQQLEQTSAFISPAFRKPEPPKRIFADRPTKHAATVTYHAMATRRDSRAAMLVKQLKTPQDMVIIREIIGPCRSKDLLYEKVS